MDEPFSQPRSPTPILYEYESNHDLNMPCLIIKHPKMSKLPFKIISCSSQDPTYPSQSLQQQQPFLTQRFCTYPQQITLQLSTLTSLTRVQLSSHPTSIASRIDILYYDPSVEERFFKYGYVQFSPKHNVEEVKEVKTIALDLSCLCLRLLIHRPHPHPVNYFSQVGIDWIKVYGVLTTSNKVEQREEKEECDFDDAYVEEKLQEIISMKQKAVDQENFEAAAIYKTCINGIKNLGVEISLYKSKKNRAVSEEMYQMASGIKKEIQKKKMQIQEIIREIFQEEEQENQFVQNSKTILNRSNLKESLLKQSFREAIRESRVVREVKETNKMNSYDQRIIPTKRPKLEEEKKEEEQLQIQNPPLEEIQGKYTKNASLMQQFYSQQITKKFFSQHWQYKLQALTKISSQAIKASSIRCMLMVVLHTLPDSNFQIAYASMQVLSLLLKSNYKKSPQISNDLDSILKEVIKKSTDTNVKIKNSAEAIIHAMIESDLFGVDMCTFALCTAKNKLSLKQVLFRLCTMRKIVEKYSFGFNNPKEIPLQCLDFVIVQLEHPAQEAKNQAISVLQIAFKKNNGIIQGKISGLKQNILFKIKDENIPILKKGNSPLISKKK